MTICDSCEEKGKLTFEEVLLGRKYDLCLECKAKVEEKLAELGLEGGALSLTNPTDFSITLDPNYWRIQPWQIYPLYPYTPPPTLPESPWSPTIIYKPFDESVYSMSGGTRGQASTTISATH